MQDTMSKARVWITVEEKIKRAFESQASAMGMTPGELLTKIVTEDYPDTLKMIESLMKIHTEHGSGSTKRRRDD